MLIKFFDKHISMSMSMSMSTSFDTELDPNLKVYALSTARGGSKSVPGKNLLNIQGKPLYVHNLLESLATPEIKATYLSTDIEEAIQSADHWGYKVIIRPDELCADSSTHTDTIYHGLLEIEKRELLNSDQLSTDQLNSDQLDYLVVMLGNTMNMDRHIIKKALMMLEADPELDSVITVIRANHFNPIRAYMDDGHGYITTYLSQELIHQKTTRVDISDKNSAGDILFQNGLWILRRRAVIQAKEQNVGMLPFNWFGNKIRYLEQDPRLQEVDDNYQIRLLE